MLTTINLHCVLERLESAPSKQAETPWGEIAHSYIIDCWVRRQMG